VFRRVQLLAFLLAAYVGSYVAYREARDQAWVEDGKRYVIFSADGTGKALYYLWRPLSYVDAAMTGTQAHIGPHDRRPMTS
jgi:hypothetical protein